MDKNPGSSGLGPPKWGRIGCRHPMFFLTPQKKLGGGFKYFFIFTPKFGEDEPILTSIFFRWVGSTTNEKNTTPISDGSKNGQENLHRQLETTQESIAQRMDFSQVKGETGNGWGQLRNGALVTGALDDKGKKTTETCFFLRGMEEETCHLRCCFGDQNIGGLFSFPFCG